MGVRVAVAGLLVAVVAVPFLGAAVRAVEAAVAFGTRGRLSVVVWRERHREWETFGKQIHKGGKDGAALFSYK